jgi:hypothetical protein
MTREYAYSKIKLQQLQYKGLKKAINNKRRQDNIILKHLLKHHLTVTIPEIWELHTRKNPIFGPIFLQPPETPKNTKVGTKKNCPTYFIVVKYSKCSRAWF